MKKSELIRELEAIPGDPEIYTDSEFQDEVLSLHSVDSVHPNKAILWSEPWSSLTN